MHLLATSSATLDEIAEPVDLAQAPAPIVVASFTDSDLAGLAAAWRTADGALPSLRLAPLAELRHPMSVDLWIERTAAHAKTVLVRILGGYEWWRYGVDRLAAAARERGIALALLPGECRDVDERLIEASTLPRAELDALLGYFREGGPDNLRALLDRLSGRAGVEARPVPKAGYYWPASGGRQPGDAPAATIPILFYRSMLLAADVAPVDALAAALEARGLAPLPIFVSSLKDGESLADFQLYDRIFKNRCSYMVYSQAFRDLPPRVKSAVITRMKAVLAGDDPAIGWLKESERKRISAILTETLPDWQG